MITDAAGERVGGWFVGRLPSSWQVEPPVVTVDREEITVVLAIDDVVLGAESSDAAREEARAGRAKAFREESREQRMQIAHEAQQRYDTKVSWGVRVGERAETWTHVAAPVMTRLRQPERRVLDTLIDANVARSRSEALAWCVRLVGQHEGDWLGALRDAMATVDDVRKRGPVA